MKKRILVVDDEPDFTLWLKVSLETGGHYEVGEEHDPRRAVRAARQFDPDLVILDIMMPDLDGSEVAALLRDDPVLRDVPVLFMTALVSAREAAGGSVQRGGQTFLSKDTPVRELVRCIEQKLEARAAVAAASSRPATAPPVRAALAG